MSGALPPVSVIVASRGRPEALQRCLSALSLQTHPQLEVILVADPPSLGVRPDLPIKRVTCLGANISDARNLGLARAAGRHVAFIDDDAVAEPVWAEALSRVLTGADVRAATGWTRGPDGFAWQDQGHRIDGLGQSHPLCETMLPSAGAGPTVLAPPQSGGAISTMGTNCAFHRDDLFALGGFDPAFAFHLDESDLNMRMSAAFPQARTAIVPDAQVMHGLAPGPVRGAGGVPRDLRAIGRSHAIFLRRHSAEALPQHETALDTLMAAQRARILRHMVAGGLSPEGVAPLLKGFAQGWRAGLEAALPPPPQPWPSDADGEFLPLHGSRFREALTLSGWDWQRNRLRNKAARLAREGHIVTLILVSPSFLPHRLRFDPRGFWEQRGGIWGASEPDDRAVILTRAAARRRLEAARALLRRVGSLRPVDERVEKTRA